MTALSLRSVHSVDVVILHDRALCGYTGLFRGYRALLWVYRTRAISRGGGLGSRPKKMYGERLGDGVEYHLMRPTPRR